jgi:hypothetical protein
MANQGTPQDTPGPGLQKQRGPAQQTGSGRTARNSEGDVERVRRVDVDDDADANRDENDRENGANQNP